MAVHITRTVALGDGRVQVWGANPSGQVAHVIVGLDKLKDGSVYPLLQLAADKLDRTAGNLRTQSTKDFGEG